MFRDKEYNRAEEIFKQILEIDPLSVDALNSIAECIKARELKKNALGVSEIMASKTFEKLRDIYNQILKVDKEDVEANFNLGLLFL